MAMAKEQSDKTPIPKDWPYKDKNGDPIPPDNFDNDWPQGPGTKEGMAHCNELIAAGKAKAAARAAGKNKK
jgi:hypothetical protein